jgi:broad specificity phosphatase PhoE
LLLYLLRHGETAWNAEKRIQGIADQPLNKVGLAQAKALIPPLAGRPITAVYSSPLVRARETARILADGLGGLPLHEECGLAELNQGDLEGMPIADIKEKYNGFWDLWRERPAEAQTPGGESLPDLQKRAWAAVELIHKRHPGEMVVAVSHNLAITTLLCRILHIDLNDMRGIRQHNASINLIEFDEVRGWGVVMMNTLSHLGPALASDEKPYL